jgi:hypothetical protein
VDDLRMFSVAMNISEVRRLMFEEPGPAYADSTLISFDFDDGNARSLLVVV